MKADTFSCFQFFGGGSRMALPAEQVAVTHGMDHPHAKGSPHVCSLLGLSRSEANVRLIELATDPPGELYLQVDGPISVVDFAVRSVVPGSAGTGGPFCSAIIEDAGDLLLLLDETKIFEVLRARLDSERSAGEGHAT